MAVKKSTGKGQASVREVRITHDQGERIFNLLRFGLSFHQVADKVDLPRQVVAAVADELEKSGRLELVGGEWTEGATWKQEQEERKQEQEERKQEQEERKRERDREKRKGKPDRFLVVVSLVALSLFLLVVEYWDSLKGVAVLLTAGLVLGVFGTRFFRDLFGK